jgi:uncharacterized protein involved in tolerance to divalent cations
MVLIYVSLPEDSQATKVAELLLRERLTNHVNIIHSIECMKYEEGAIKKSAETILLIKTKALLYKQIQQRILELELSPTPNIFSVPMTQLDGDYHDYLLKDVVKV